MFEVGELRGQHFFIIRGTSSERSGWKKLGVNGMIYCM